MLIMINVMFFKIDINSDYYNTRLDIAEKAILS